MFRLLVIFYVIKLYARVNNFDNVQDVVTETSFLHMFIKSAVAEITLEHATLLTMSIWMYFIEHPQGLLL